MRVDCIPACVRLILEVTLLQVRQIQKSLLDHWYLFKDVKVTLEGGALLPQPIPHS